jgi:hypothetical protein
MIAISQTELKIYNPYRVEHISKIYEWNNMTRKWCGHRYDVVHTLSEQTEPLKVFISQILSDFKNWEHQDAAILSPTK